MNLDVVCNELVAALDRTVPPGTSYLTAYGDARMVARALRRIEQAVMDASRLLDTFDSISRPKSAVPFAVPSDEDR